MPGGPGHRRGPNRRPGLADPLTMVTRRTGDMEERDGAALGYSDRQAMSATPSRPLRPRLTGLALLVIAASCFAAIVIIRQGPPPGGDTVPLTTVTSDLASGHLQAAA